MQLVEQVFDQPRVADVVGATRDALNPFIGDRIHRGQRVAIPVGSRGIRDIVAVVKTLVAIVKEHGGTPFIVPAMGSHGGGTAEGQRRVLETLGITEATVAAPILSSMDVVPIGSTLDGVSVVMDAYAANADHILVVNRVKPHTEFSGCFQSGLVKMLLIGLGKHTGALNYHQAAMEIPFESLLRTAAGVVIERTPILAGIAMLENANEETAEIIGLHPSRFLLDEGALLARAAALMATIPFDHVDLLIVDEMGKNISGSGMDTNVIRRKHWANTQIGEIVEQSAPRRIIVRDLTPETEGNAAGIGLADFTLERVLAKVDWHKTRTNAVTATRPRGAMTPIVCANDEEAFEMALASAGVRDAATSRVIRLRDTLHLRNMLVSEALLEHAHQGANIRTAGGGKQLAFDGSGMLEPDKLS
jgi:hypothetical protein